MRFIVSILLTLFSSLVIAQSNTELTFGGQKNDIGYSLCIADDGGYMLAGNTRSYGSGSNDIFLIKLNENYQTEWTVTNGREHQDFVRKVIPFNAGYAIFGNVWGYNSGLYNIYMQLLDNEGSKISEDTYGTSAIDFGFSGIESNSGNFLIIGYSRGVDDYGGIYLVMTDKNGHEIWNNSFGYDYDDYALDGIENQDGSFMIIGSKDGFFDDVHANYKTHDADIMLLKIDSTGNEIWNLTYGEEGHDFGYSIEHADDGYYLFGSTQSYGAGSFDMMLTKVNTEGVEDWHTTYGGENFDYGISIDKNAEGDLYLLGSSKSFGQDNSVDIYLIKTDNAGNEIWNLTIGGILSDYGQQVVATSDSGCAIIGTTNSFGSGKKDMLFAKINKFGEIEQYLDVAESNINDIVIAPNPMRDNGQFIIQNNIVDEYTLVITTLSGAIAKQYKLSFSNPKFSTSSLSSGIYIYKLTGNNSKQTLAGKLVIY